MSKNQQEAAIRKDLKTHSYTPSTTAASQQKTSNAIRHAMQHVILKGFIEHGS